MNHWFLLTVASEIEHFYQLGKVEDIKIQSKGSCRVRKAKVGAKKNSSNNVGERQAHQFLYTFTHSLTQFECLNVLGSCNTWALQWSWGCSEPLAATS